MILLRLKGGLGNQLFQYATARSLSIKYQCPILLDRTSYLPHQKLKKSTTYRQFGLWIYELSNIPNVYNSEKSNSYKQYIECINQKLTASKITTIFREKDPRCFDEEVFKLSPPFILDGYFQSRHYFSDFHKVLIKDFTLATTLDSANLKFIDIINSTNSVAVHIRRGDYVTNAAANSHHGSLPLSYYVSAINFVQDQVIEPVFNFFSDDLEWCKKYFSFLSPRQVNFIDINKGAHPSLDLNLMSQNKHIIIANSSYSWWAAWLTKNKKGFVLYPSEWVQKDFRKSELFPCTWTKIYC